ncbi:MAG TPA: adenylate/guanylate cyclase domain-containing protein [Anaerolineales bacterium]|nr:adenylate/guanylate cyclase domain-containing protein [Anaerolineales bacterium]
MSNLALTELLASYVPRLIQNRVITNPSPIESPVAEEFQAAILFADISGFTLLTERMMARGPTGVETLARILNEYFGQLIDIVHDYGGDVVKFAGDAVIAVWPIVPDLPEAGPVTRADQWQWTMRAAECALEVHRRLTNYEVENANLYLKLAISMGNISTAHVGGVFNRWEFLITGTPLVELGIANSLANASEILITPSAWKLIRNDSIADPMEFELKDAIAQGGRLEGLNKPSSIFSSPRTPVIPEGAENSLRPYIPGAIINRLTAGQNSWIAELRRVTVLFINLPDLDQTTALEKAQAIARLIQRSVYRYEGSINKINVDDKGITIVAALGLPPFAHEDDPARGVQAALMIRKELTKLNIRSYIGITTGRIFCGSIGNESRREYTIIGNAVNLSARLMGAASRQDELTAKYGVPILCDRLTYDSAKDAVEFEPFAPQQVKGRQEPVEVFHPLEQKKSVIRPKTELIGRQEEKTSIANALQELARGEPHQTLVVLGEAGIGKSRLFEDLIRQAETLRVRMFTGTGDPIEKSNPYHAWRPIFNKILELDDVLAGIEHREDIPAAVQNRVSAVLARIDPDLARYAPLIDIVLPTDIPDNEFTASLTGEIRSSNIREVLTRILSFEASQAPVLIVLEDLHWFDSASWALLVDVQQKVRPLFLALNTRPLADPVPAQFKEILETPGAQLVKLEAMTLDDVEALVCQRLGVRSVPPLIGRLIREKSEGHPFFAEELAYALRDSGVLVLDNQECRLYSRFTEFEDLTLPDTLQAAITNRIDSLNPSQQLTLKVASVIGRIFAFRVLQAIHPIEADKASLSDCMDSLTRLSMTLVESETPDLAYIFKHAVTQEVAYNLMLFSQRRQLHQAVAEWIESNHARNLEAYYILLAHHWSQAAQTTESEHNNHALQKAVEYLEKAGEQGMQNYANKEAIQFLSQALELDQFIPGPEVGQIARDRQTRRARWHSRIGLAHYGLGSLPDCERHAREALHLLGYPIPKSRTQFVFGVLSEVIRQVFHRYFPWRFIGSLKGNERELSLEVSRLFELMGRIYFYSQETLPIIYSILRFVNIAERAGSSPELASSYSAMAVLAGFAQLHSLAEIYVNRALAIAEEVNQPSNLITVQVVTSVYQISVGKWEEIRARAEKAKALCEQIGDYRQWGDSMDVLGESALISGDLTYATTILTRLLEDARQRRNPLQVSWGLFGMGTIHIRQGNDASAVAMLLEALEILEERPNLASSIDTNGQLALAYLHLGEEEQAIRYADKVLEMAADISPTVYSLDIGFSAVAEVYFALWEKAHRDTASGADADQHKSSAEKALKLLRSFEKVFPIGRPYTRYYQGWFEDLTGKPQLAVRTWRAGLEAAQKFKLPYEEGLIRVKLGSRLRGEPDAHNGHFERAIQIFEKMGAVHDLRIVKKAQAGFDM